VKSLQIIYSKTAVKAISNLDRAVKQRIKSGIEGLLEVPPKGDIKQMRGSNPLIYRLRIGKYRILYESGSIDGEQVLLIKDIGSRGDIYK
jgi:mRNA-degrading endonuclease RelE of RelBE toxin-antitoxin system